MLTTPPWLAATAGAAGNAGQVNQLLGAHTSTWFYGGTLQASQATGAVTFQSSFGTYLAQSFTTGAAQTAIGSVQLQLNAVNGSLVSETIAPATLSLYLSSSGVPTGGALATASLDEITVAGSGYWVSFPIAATGLTASTLYELVLASGGTSGTYYAWRESNQVFGAATSPDGATWTTQAYGLTYRVYDQSAGGSTRVTYLSDDDGARWAALTYDAATGRLTQIAEYAQAQGAGAVLTSTRTLTYTSGLLTGVT